MKKLAVVAFAVASVLVERGASAGAPCGESGRPWVKIVVDELPASLVPFVSLLRAELTSRGIELCTSTSIAAPPPVATVRVSPHAGDSVALAVEVRDAITEKQVNRDVSLAGIPSDGQPLTLAAATDELLRASWAELALRTAPPPARPVPPQVVETVREALPPPARPSAPTVQLGASFVWEHYSHGLTLYGADARLGAWVTRRLEAALQFGLRNGATAQATDGTVQPSAWSLSARGLFTFTPLESRWGVDGVAALDVERLTLVPTPNSGAIGAEQSGYAVLGGVGPEAWLAVLPALRLGAEVLGTAPLRGADAVDATTRFVGLSGVGWSVQFGLWSAL